MAVSSVANSHTFKVTVPSDREIRMTRLFDAPRHLVFEAMSKPEHIRRWWGQLGEGYSVPVCEMDFRQGGKWRFVNRHPRGDAEFYGSTARSSFPNAWSSPRSTRPSRTRDPLSPRSLTEEDGKTRLSVTSVYPSIEVRDMVLKSGMEHGAAASYDKLEEVARGLQNA